MSSAPAITVGIPFHDEVEHLGDAVRSVLGGTFRDVEVLLVDDGSRDGSLAVARSFEHDPRVRVLSDGLRKNLPARLDEITAAARGELVARMDADDVMHPERLAKELATLEKGYDAVGTWAVMVDGAGEPFGTVEASLPTDAGEALVHGVFPHATMLARRELLRAHPYDASLTRAEDRDLFCRLVTAGARLGVVPEALYVIRVSPADVRFLPDYRIAHAQNRRIFRVHGPRVLGRARTARLVAASYAKVLVTTTAARLGLLDALVRRRGRPPTDAERRMAREALSAAR